MSQQYRRYYENKTLLRTLNLAFVLIRRRGGFYLSGLLAQAGDVAIAIFANLTRSRTMRIAKAISLRLKNNLSLIV